MREEGQEGFVASRNHTCGGLPTRTVRQSFSACALVVCAAILAVLAVLGAGRIVSVQARQADQMGAGQQNSAPYFGDMDPVLKRRQLRALNAARQQELVRDTVKLLKLATDLNAEIKTAQPAHLSPEELSKVAHIEKLARSVREKMSQTIVGGPPVEDPIAQPFR